MKNLFDSPEYWSEKRGVDEELSDVFHRLKPEDSAEFIEACGLGSAAKTEVRDLGSIENRVFTTAFKNHDGKLCDAVVKIYRPGQWPEESLLEEHGLMKALAAANVSIVAPFSNKSGTTLFKHRGIFYAIFPFKKGSIEEVSSDFPTEKQTLLLGRTIAEMHDVAAQISITARPTLKPETYGRGNLAYLLKNNILPVEFHAELTEILEETIALTQPVFKNIPLHAIHADLYEGNIVWENGVPFIIDFDDLMIGPALQDVRMLFRGRDADTARRIDTLLKGYREVRFFDENWLKLIEPMRIFRNIWYQAWIAARRHDSRFDNVMPDFGSAEYWPGEMKFFRSQLQLVREIPF